MGTTVVIGGDRRLSFLAEGLTGYFEKVILYAGTEDEGEKSGVNKYINIEACGADSVAEVMRTADIIIGPVPFSKDGVHVFSEGKEKVRIEDFYRGLREKQVLFGGNIPVEVISEAEKKGVFCRDFLQIEEVETENALTTAEGAVAEAIGLSLNNIHSGKCMVLGYGKCGKAIARLLKAWGIDTTIAARSETALAQAGEEGYGTVLLKDMSDVISGMLFIFNTIPAMVLKEKEIAVLKEDAVIVDIASSPGGTDFAACERAGIKTVLSLGIPGRYSPKTSAEILLRAILKEREKMVEL